MHRRGGPMIVRNPARVYTPEDLLAMPDGDRYELVDGQLLEHEMSAGACRVAARVIRLLESFSSGKKCGLVLTSDTTYQCYADHPGRVRRPDVSFIAAGRLPREQLEGHVRIAPDLAVEVVSPNDLAYEVE